MIGVACKLTCKTAFVPDFVKSTSCTVDVAAACSSCGRSSGKINGQTYDCGYEAPVVATKAGQDLVSCPVKCESGTAPSWMKTVSVTSLADCAGMATYNGCSTYAP